MTAIGVSELFERFDRVRRDEPGRPLIRRPVTGDVVTAEGLAALAMTFRDNLSRAGAASGRPFVSLAGNTTTGIALFVACRALSVPFLPIDRSASSAEALSIAQRFGARLVAGSPGHLEGAREVAPLSDGLTLMALSEPAFDMSGSLADVAVMKVTSGSTGVPRAVLATDSNLIADTFSITTAMDIRPDDVQLAAIPLSHAYGFGNLLMPLLLNGTAIVLRDGFVPHQFSRDGASHGITVFPGVPYMFDHLSAHLAEDGWPRRLTRLMSAGARLEPSSAARFHRKFGLKIHSFYGTSESGGICFDDGDALDAEPTVGRPIPNVVVTLRPDEGAPAGGGRVHVAGPAVSRGYAGGGEDQADEQPFVHGGFLTGDLGRFNSRCELELHGRVSSFVNIAGRKVQPQEVEGVLRTAAGVLDVRVVGVPDPLRGQELVACIVCAEGGTSAANLRAHCSTQLAPFKIPRRFLFVDAIPLTERGKTDRMQLEALAARWDVGTS